MSRDKGLGIEDYRVQIGTVHLNQDPDTYSQTLSVADYVSHPDYDPVTFDNDIALLKLQNPATLNQRVKIARIAEKGYHVGEHCVVAGWGKDSTGNYPEWLQEVSVRYV